MGENQNVGQAELPWRPKEKDLEEERRKKSSKKRRSKRTKKPRGPRGAVGEDEVVLAERSLMIEPHNMNAEEAVHAEWDHAAIDEGYRIGRKCGLAAEQIDVVQHIFFDKQNHNRLGPPGIMAMMDGLKVKRMPLEWQLQRVLMDAAVHRAKLAGLPFETAAGNEDLTYPQFIEEVAKARLMMGAVGDMAERLTLDEMFHLMDFDSFGDDDDASDAILSEKEVRYFLDEGGRGITLAEASAMIRMVSACPNVTLIPGEDFTFRQDEFADFMLSFKSHAGNDIFSFKWNPGMAGIISKHEWKTSLDLWYSFRGVLFVMVEINSLYDRCLPYSEEYLEQWTADVRARVCFFNPDAPSRQAWDLAMLPLFAMIIIMVPLRIGFDYDEPPDSPLFWVDVLTDVYFLVDIFVNFRTAYIDNHGQLVTDLGKIASMYLWTWFPIDFISCLPITYVFLLVAHINEEEGGGGGQVKLAKILRLARLAKNLARCGTPATWTGLQHDGPNHHGL